MAGPYLLVIVVAYLSLLLFIAWRAERSSPTGKSTHRRAVIYSLSLAVTFAAWAYYGTTGDLYNGSWLYLPNFLGPIIVMTVLFPIWRRIAVAAKRENVGSIADFLSSRYGKSRALGTLTAVVSLIGSLPYLADQLTSIPKTWAVVAGNSQLSPLALPVVVVALAVSAILLGARSPTLTRHNRGLLRMIAIESAVKILALLAVAALAIAVLAHRQPVSVGRLFTELGRPPIDVRLFTATIMCTAFTLTWPRQFHLGFVELENVDDLKTARWLFPLYVALWAVAVVPIAVVGRILLPHLADATTVVLQLPLAFSGPVMAGVAFLGGFSTSTGMVLIETVALSAMISNEILLPWLTRTRWGAASPARDSSRLIVDVRRVAIVSVLVLAWAYVALLDRYGGLQRFDFLSLIVAAQLAPALVGAVVWRRGHARGAICGIVAGVALWGLLVVAPKIVVSIHPHALDALTAHPLSGFLLKRASICCLGVNILVYIAVSLRMSPRLIDRVQAAAFVGPGPPAPSTGQDAILGSVGELRALIEQFLGPEDAKRAFEDFERGRSRRIRDDDPVSPSIARAAERMLAGAIGGSSARNVIGLALASGGRQASQISQMLDEAAQAVQFSRELLQTSLDSLDQGVCVVDRDVRLVAWNNRYLQMFGYGADEIYVGKPLEELIRRAARLDGQGGATAEALIADRIGPILRRERQEFEYDWPGGLTLRVVGAPISSGEYVTSFTDVSQLRASARALEQSNELLEHRVAERTQALTDANLELQVAKGQAERATNSQARFVAAASHDLLQPLHAARLFLGAAAEDLSSGGGPRDLVAKADVSIEAADRLLRALLNLSRLEVDGVKPEFAAVDLNAVLTGLRRDFEPLARNQGLILQVLPTRAWAQSDPDLLRSVLQNLIGNAVRYTPAGGRVLVGCRRRAGALCIEVHDTGPGIAAHELPTIFREFSRLSDGVATASGAGLGLAIAERVCRALGHPLDVRSTVGAGSVFSVTAPRSRSAPAAAPATRAPMLPGSLRVLCLDDEPAVLESTASLMRRWGVEVAVAATFEEAERLAGPWDVILADYHLGEVRTGLDFLRAVGGGGAVLALITANSTEPLLAQASALGVEVIRKPLAPAALRAFLIRAAAVERVPVRA